MVQPLLPGWYRSPELVGGGASADVWRADDARSGARVAIKVARSESARSALAREAHVALLAPSPHLPELIDAGVEGDTAFVALRWVEGTPLSALLQRGDAEQRRRIGLAVARDAGQGLADLHALGLAHGDLKPDNLLVDAAGAVHVLDLGLASDVTTREPMGATPRYLARGDAELGDAAARDRLALGIVLAEIASDAVRSAPDALRAARAAALPAPIDELCVALLAATPGTRPGAAWIAERAAAALGGAAGVDDDRGPRRVRATYLRLRRHELGTARAARGDVAPWLADAVTKARRARALLGADATDGVLSPLAPDDLVRWLLLLVGPAAAAWPLPELVSVPERALGDALVALARRVDPQAWTLSDVLGAVRGQAEPRARPRYDGDGPLDAAESAELAVALQQTPPDAAALAAVERRRDTPAPLVLAAAEALRRSGGLGRARALVGRLEATVPAARALAAEILRRSGDRDRARALAEPLADTPGDAGVRARAVLARLALDAGDVARAERLAGEASSAPLCEVGALSASQRGDVPAALSLVGRGEALAANVEERARLRALRGYVLHPTDPAAALAAFEAAVDDASRAGAVVEEATYRTGEAAAAVDVGDLGRAIATSQRASLLWEHLERPQLAARATLATAAAWATLGREREAVQAAQHAAALARTAGDSRAEGYAWLARADVAAARSADGVAAAERAVELLGGGGDDELRAAARALRHRPDGLDSARVAAYDAAARRPGGDAAPRLEWWSARARRLLAEGASPEAASAAPVLSALNALAEARAAVDARGPALAAGRDLALAVGQGDVALRFDATLSDLVRELVRRAPPDLVDAIGALPWTQRNPGGDGAIRPEQARDVALLVRSLGERERLGALLTRVVDALVLWTGVERGLLLMRAPDGRLVPRAARNLARADLVGAELELSQTLARRAMTERAPVVAVDAMGELGSSAQSVHALSLRSVLAVPLVARGEVLGVAYLDDRVRRGAFGPRELAWADTVASIAAVAIADARDQVLLRRAARRARRATAELAETLAHREAALDVAERELAKSKAARSTRFTYAGIVGESEAMQVMLRVVDRVSQSDVPVLLVGESGSGKELVARAIHENGPRAGARFVSENCGAIPEGLLESALFGHVRGAFTGADRPRAGLFEIADRGTLFLDEIGETSLAMQTRLLRILEDGMLRPVGSERSRRVDVRIIAATNRDLAAMVREKRFREDLLYRLDIVMVRIPPLRERAGDIPLLVRHLLDKHGGDNPPRVTPAALAHLAAFRWPGNVRQLENEIRRAVVLADGAIDVEQLSPELARVDAAPAATGLNVRARLDALEVELVRDALRRTNGNQTKAAKLLGLSRFGLQKMIRRLAIGVA